MTGSWAALHGFFSSAGSVQFPANQGRGHRGWWVSCGLVWHELLGWSCQCFCLCGSLHGCSSRPAFMVQVADKDPLRWALLLHVHGSLGTLGGWSSLATSGTVISVHLDGTVVMKTSPSVKVTSGSIALHWSSCTLLTRQQGWLGTGGMHLLSPILQRSIA